MLNRPSGSRCSCRQAVGVSSFLVGHNLSYPRTDRGGVAVEAKNWTLETLRSTPKRRFMKSHANLKDLPVGSAQGLKVSVESGESS